MGRVVYRVLHCVVVSMLVLSWFYVSVCVCLCVRVCVHTPVCRFIKSSLC